jgi:urease accessory protein
MAMKRGVDGHGTDVVSGAAEIGFALRCGTTRLAHLYQRTPLRVLFPTPDPGESALAVLVTTSGGLVAGDRIAISVRADAGAVAHVTTAAAEKIYRSTGATAQIGQSAFVADAAWLEYLPQETILFDGARLRRNMRVSLAIGAGFLGGSIIVFGRRARGEGFTRGLLQDRFELLRGGALVWGDAVHLDGEVVAVMADPACLDNSAAYATLVLAPPGAADPAGFIDAARAELRRSAGDGLRAGVTAVNGVVVARWLAADALPLRRAFADLACHFRAAAIGLPAQLPRLWHV